MNTIDPSQMSHYASHIGKRKMEFLNTAKFENWKNYQKYLFHVNTIFQVKYKCFQNEKPSDWWKINKGVVHFAHDLFNWNYAKFFEILVRGR